MSDPISTPSTKPITNSSCIDNYGLIRSNYDQRIMTLYKFDEKPQEQKGYVKPTSEERSKYDRILKKLLGY